MPGRDPAVEPLVTHGMVRSALGERPRAGQPSPRGHLARDSAGLEEQSQQISKCPARQVPSLSRARCPQDEATNCLMPPCICCSGLAATGLQQRRGCCPCCMHGSHGSKPGLLARGSLTFTRKSNRRLEISEVEQRQISSQCKRASRRWKAALLLATSPRPPSASWTCFSCTLQPMPVTHPWSSLLPRITSASARSACVLASFRDCSSRGHQGKCPLTTEKVSTGICGRMAPKGRNGFRDPGAYPHFQ